MIKFEHTLFVLPFAFLGAMLAANGFPSWPQILWITIAMVGARSAAMSFNRIADQKIDAENPRTADREIPSGKLSVEFAWSFMIASSLVFFLASFMLNRLTLILSPIALLSVLGYSYAKRFTSFAHLILGWALAIAPTGAWIAVRGTIDSEICSKASLLVLYVQLYVEAQVVVITKEQHPGPVRRYINERSEDKASSIRVSELSNRVCVFERSGDPLFRDRKQIVFVAI